MKPWDDKKETKEENQKKEGGELGGNKRWTRRGSFLLQGEMKNTNKTNLAFKIHIFKNSQGPRQSPKAFANHIHT